MKANKFWSVLAMLFLGIFTCVSLSSCGDDDEGGNGSGGDSALVGSWEQTFVDEDMFGVWTETTTITFKSDGTGVTLDEEVFTPNPSASGAHEAENFSYELKFKWSASGNKLTITYKDPEEGKTVTNTCEYKIEGRTVTFYYNDEEPEVFTRKK